VGIEVVGSFVGLGVGNVDGAELGAGLGMREGLELGTGVVGSLVGLGEGISDGLKVGSSVVGNLLGLGEGIKDGAVVGNPVGEVVGWQVVHDNVNDTSTPPLEDPPRYSCQVSVTSGGVLSHWGFISLKIRDLPSPSIAQLTLDE